MCWAGWAEALSPFDSVPAHLGTRETVGKGGSMVVELARGQFRETPNHLVCVLKFSFFMRT